MLCANLLCARPDAEAMGVHLRFGLFFEDQRPIEKPWNHLFSERFGVNQDRGQRGFTLANQGYCLINPRQRFANVARQRFEVVNGDRRSGHVAIPRVWQNENEKTCKPYPLCSQRIAVGFQ